MKNESVELLESDIKMAQTMRAAIAKLKSIRDFPSKKIRLQKRYIFPHSLFDKMVELGVIDKKGNEL